MTAWYSMKRNILKRWPVCKARSCRAEMGRRPEFWTYDEGTFGDRYGYDPENTLYNHYRSNGVIRRTRPRAANGWR